MIDIISKSFPVSQAKQEASWIQSELPPQNWVEASIQRSKFVPLQYILGNQPFGKLDLLCQPEVLIPRLDTEEWIFEVCKLMKDQKISNVVDYCTGSGCIGLTLASELKNISKVYCIDYKSEAVQLSKKNLEHNKHEMNVPVEICKANIFDSYLPNIVDFKNTNKTSILFSNPPYIPEKDLVIGEVEESVLKYEPKDALLGDLEFYLALSKQILLPNPAFKAFVFELGYQSQADIVKKNLPNDWTVGIRYDSSNHLRNVIGWKNNTSLEILSNMIHNTI